MTHALATTTERQSRSSASGLAWPRIVRGLSTDDRKIRAYRSNNVNFKEKSKC